MKVFRTPKTQNERSQNALLLVEIKELGVKVKYRSRYLPTEWDDIPLPWNKYPRK